MEKSRLYGGGFKKEAEQKIIVFAHICLLRKQLLALPKKRIWGSVCVLLTAHSTLMYFATFQTRISINLIFIQVFLGGCQVFRYTRAKKNCRI